MPILITAIVFGVFALYAVGKIVQSSVEERPCFPWEYVFAISSMLGVLSLYIANATRLPSAQFRDVAPASKPEGGSFITLGAHGLGTSKLNDPEVKKLFATSGGLGGDEDCKKHVEAIGKLNSAQRDELVKILAQVFDPGRWGPPPLKTSNMCALALAASISPLDERLVGPLLTLINNTPFVAWDAARVLKGAKLLPSNLLSEELARLELKAAAPFMDVLKQVPVDDFEPFASRIGKSTGIEELALLMILARAPRPDERTATHIRKILASPDNGDLRRVALIAAPNALPAQEALQALSELVRLPAGAVTLGIAVAVANDKPALSALVPMMLESWDPFDITGNETRVETLIHLREGLVANLPLAARRMLLVPENRPNWEQLRHRAAENCYRSLGGSGGRSESSCLPDVVPPFGGRCDGRRTDLSPRLQRIIESLATGHPLLMAKLGELLNAGEPQLREFAVRVLGKLGDEAAQRMLQKSELDQSVSVGAAAYAEELRLRPDDSDLKKGIGDYLFIARNAGCFVNSSFLRAVAMLGEQGIAPLLQELEGGASSAAAAEALAGLKSIPTAAEPRLLALLQSPAVTSCENAPLISSLLTLLMKIELPTEQSIGFVRRVIDGQELTCCDETKRLRAGLGALAAAAADHPHALELLKSRYSQSDKLPGGQAEINRALLRASPTDGRRVMQEVGLATAAETQMGNAVRHARGSLGRCPTAQGTTIDIRSRTTIGPKSSPEEIAAHFGDVAAEIEGKEIDHSRGKFDRLLGESLMPLQLALEKDPQKTLEIRNERCETVLHGAISRGLSEHLRLIMSKKPELDLRTKAGLTPLMIAAARNDVSMVGMLLDAGAAIDLHDFGEPYSQTALALAAKNGAWDTVKLLLARGASLTAGKPPEPLVSLLIGSGDQELIERAKLFSPQIQCEKVSR